MTKKVKRSTSIALWGFSFVAVGLLITSFFVPPTGVIDPSVLKAGSLIFAFAALFEVREAIAEGLGVKLTHGDTTVVVHDMDGKPHDHSGPGHIHDHESDHADEPGEFGGNVNLDEPIDSDVGEA